MNIKYIFERQHRRQKLWLEHAVVTKHRDILQQIEEMQYQPEYDDFIKEYLPFYNPATWMKLDGKKQKLLLSFGWFMYNLKTIIIEQSALT